MLEKRVRTVILLEICPQIFKDEMKKQFFGSKFPGQIHRNLCKWRLTLQPYFSQHATSQPLQMPLVPRVCLLALTQSSCPGILCLEAHLHLLSSFHASCSVQSDVPSSGNPNLISPGWIKHHPMAHCWYQLLHGVVILYFCFPWWTVIFLRSVIIYFIAEPQELETVVIGMDSSGEV